MKGWEGGMEERQKEEGEEERASPRGTLPSPAGQQGEGAPWASRS